MVLRGFYVDVIDRVLAARRRFLTKWGVEPTVVYMGREDYNDIRSCRDWYNYLSVENNGYYLAGHKLLVVDAETYLQVGLEER